MAYIKIINPDEAHGDLKQVYDELEMQPGSELAEINGVFSLEPTLLKARMLTSSAVGGVYGTTGFDSRNTNGISNFESTKSGARVLSVGFEQLIRIPICKIDTIKTIKQNFTQLPRINY